MGGKPTRYRPPSAEAAQKFFARRFGDATRSQTDDTLSDCRYKTGELVPKNPRGRKTAAGR